MKKLIFLIGLWTTLFEIGSLGRLITKPVNEAPMWFWYNHSINCSSSFGSAAIRWYFIAVDETANVTIAAGSVVNPSYVHLYRIEQPTSLASNLIFHQPSNLTAGTYVCSDNEMEAMAESVVIYEFPTLSELPTRSITNGDSVNVSCTVHYIGNRLIEPMFYVYDIDDVDHPILIHNISSSTHSREGTVITATATFVHTAICPKLKSFRCDIFFGKPKGEPLLGAATNAPNHVLQREFLPENVSCVPATRNMTITGAVSGGIVSAGTVLTCHVSSFPSANYSWMDLRHRNSSSGPHLTVWHDGSYQCTASNYFDRQWHTASKTIENITVERHGSRVKPLHEPIAGDPEVQMTVETYWRQLVNIKSSGNKPKSTLYSDLLRRDKPLFIAAGIDFPSPLSRDMRPTRTVTRKQHHFSNKDDEYIGLWYRIATTNSHQMNCTRPDLHTLGFVILINLIALIFFIHRCCWSRRARYIPERALPIVTDV